MTRTVHAHTELAKAALARKLDELPIAENDRRELACLLSKFTAAVVRLDRERRYTHDSLEKVADILGERKTA